VPEINETGRLLVRRPDGETEFHELHGDTRVGRAEDMDLVLEDPSVSRQHALLRWEDGAQFVIADLGSANGTWRNGDRIALPVPLRNGDDLRMGSVEMRFLAPRGVHEGHRGASVRETLDATSTMGQQADEVQPTLIARAPLMMAALELAHQASQSPIPVMIEGETGTGKELLARAIHADGPRADAPFVAINCASLPEGLLESELFGHRKGAFTGASTDRIGLLEAAHGGSVLLDEIGEMPPAMQPKLLRFLQEGEIHRIGENQPRNVDVRVLGATHRCLADEVREGRFREDLFFRLTPIMISLPPLRDRIEDVPLLAGRLLARACRRHERPEIGLSAGALRVLSAYSWPGNVRELENELLRAVAMNPQKEILEEADLSSRILAPEAGSDALESLDSASGSQDSEVPGGGTVGTAVADVDSDTSGDNASLRGALSRFERQHIEDVLEKKNGNVSATARALGVSRGALHRKLKDFGLR